MARNRLEALVEPLFGPAAERLARTGLSPHLLTVLSLALTLPAAGLVATGRPVLGSALALFATSLDWLDGQVARRSNRVTRAGNFLDSTLDRWGDLALLGGAAVLFRSSLVFLVAALVAMTSAVLVSYARAKAESLGAELTIGAMQRTERIALYCGGGLAGGLLDPLVAQWPSSLPFEVPPHPTFAVAIVLLALWTTVTAIRRTAGGFRAIRSDERAHRRVR